MLFSKLWIPRFLHNITVYHHLIICHVNDLDTQDFNICLFKRTSLWIRYFIILSYLKPQAQCPTFSYHQYAHNVPILIMLLYPVSHILIASICLWCLSHILTSLIFSWCPTFSHHYYPHYFPYSHDIKMSMMSHLLIASICSWCHTFSQHQYSGHAPTCSVYPTLLHHCCLTFSCFLCCLHSLQVHVIFSPRKVFSCKPPLIKLMFPKAATFLKSFLFQKLWEVA